MKLKYRIWEITGPRASELDQYSGFPLDMLRYDPAYIHDDGMSNILTHSERGGLRDEQHDKWVMIYTQIPGYLSSVRIPTFDRWRSFGWGNIKEVKDKDFIIGDPRHWNTIIGFNGNDPLILTLQDFMDCKNMDKWRDMVYKLRYPR